jgi:hypothetical protein
VRSQAQLLQSDLLAIGVSLHKKSFKVPLTLDEVIVD